MKWIIYATVVMPYFFVLKQQIVLNIYNLTYLIYVTTYYGNGTQFLKMFVHYTFLSQKYII
jgi:hypothetical protein